MATNEDYAEVTKALRDTATDSGPEAVIRLLLSKSGTVGFKQSYRDTWIYVPVAVRPGAWGRIINALRAAIEAERLP